MRFAIKQKKTSTENCIQKLALQVRKYVPGTYILLKDSIICTEFTFPHNEMSGNPTLHRGRRAWQNRILILVFF